jgi:hypothetical protein
MADHGSGYFLLQLPDVWEFMLSKAASFEAAARGSGADTLALEYLRELQSQRAACCVHKFSCRRFTAEHAAQFRQYLASLAHLLEKGEPGRVAGLAFEWNSPLGGKPGRFWRLEGAELELAMVGRRAGHGAAAVRALLLRCACPRRRAPPSEPTRAAAPRRRSSSTPACCRRAATRRWTS